MQTPNGQGRAGFTPPMAETNETDDAIRRTGFIPSRAVFSVGFAIVIEVWRGEPRPTIY